MAEYVEVDHRTGRSIEIWKSPDYVRLCEEAQYAVADETEDGEDEAWNEKENVVARENASLERELKRRGLEVEEREFTTPAGFLRREISLVKEAPRMEAERGAVLLMQCHAIASASTTMTAGLVVSRSASINSENEEDDTRPILKADYEHPKLDALLCVARIATWKLEQEEQKQEEEKLLWEQLEQEQQREKQQQLEKTFAGRDEEMTRREQLSIGEKRVRKAVKPFSG